MNEQVNEKMQLYFTVIKAFHNGDVRKKLLPFLSNTFPKDRAVLLHDHIAYYNYFKSKREAQNYITENKI